jgi:hypothetical protein
MATVYSIVMYEQHDLDGDSGDLVVPEGFVWVLRSLDVVNGSPLNFVALKGSVGQLIWVNSFATPVGFDYASWRGRQVVQPGEVLSVQSTAPADVTLSGYQLSLP